MAPNSTSSSVSSTSGSSGCCSGAGSVGGGDNHSNHSGGSNSLTIPINSSSNVCLDATNRCSSTTKNRKAQTEIEIPETINRGKKDISLPNNNKQSINGDCFAGAYSDCQESIGKGIASDSSVNSHLHHNHHHPHHHLNSTPANVIPYGIEEPDYHLNDDEDNNNFCNYSHHSNVNSHNSDHLHHHHHQNSSLSHHGDLHHHPPPASPVKVPCPGYTRLNQRLTMSNYVKTGLTMLYAMLAMTSNLFVLAWVHERVPMTSKSLPDLGFDLFPRVDWVLNISEYIIMGEVTLLFIVITLHRYRQLLVRRMCLIMGTLYIFRAVCMASTVFPVANDKYYCSPQMRDSQHPDQPIPLGQHVSVVFQRVWHMLGGIGLSINGKHSYCGDYMYSGHTVMLTFCYLFIREYSFPLRLRTLSSKFANALLLGCSCTGILCVIISRGHYLIDIFVAYFATTRLFWIYHTMAHNQMLMIRTPSNYLSNVWWFRLFIYFEMNCSTDSDFSSLGSSTEHLNRICSCPRPKYCECSLPGVPRIFEWPLPWPRWFRRRTPLLPCHQRLLPQQHT